MAMLMNTVLLIDGYIQFSLLVDPSGNAHEYCTNLLIDGYYTILYLLILMAMLMNTVLLIDGYYTIISTC
jgi:hypothetical protein